MYKRTLESYLMELYTIAPSPNPFCFSHEAADWLEAAFNVRDGESYDPINRDAIDVQWMFGGNISQRKFVYGNLYTCLLVNGINIPYWKYVYEDAYEDENSQTVYFKDGNTCSLDQWNLAKAC